MNSKLLVGVAAVAAVVVLGAAVLITDFVNAKRAAAQVAAINTGRAAYYVKQEKYKHAAGSEVLYLTFDGVQFVDNAKKPLDRAHQVCHATCLVKMLDAQCRGYCSAIDDDGDIAWVTWDRLKEGGGTWKYLGGTGKYAGETGGGTWTAGGQHGPNMVSNFWKRTY